MIELSVDGAAILADEGSTILDACRRAGIDTPTLCYGETLEPASVCRVCVVELEGSRTLVPACSRAVEAGMVVQTESERVRTSRRLVLELLGSSVDLSRAPAALAYLDRYEADPARFGAGSSTVAQPVKVDNDLYVRDYSRCILCYQCVDAAGFDALVTEDASRVVADIEVVVDLHRLSDGLGGGVLPRVVLAGPGGVALVGVVRRRWVAVPGRVGAVTLHPAAHVG